MSIHSAADRQPNGRSELLPGSLPMVDARDGVCHCLDDDVHGADLAAGCARFRTLCGRAVLAASLTTPIGPPWCDPCRSEARRRKVVNSSITASASQNRVWFRRMTGLFGRSGWWSG